MDIGGTAKKIQKATKVAEESYKKMQLMMEKMQEMMEQMQQMQTDMETTSRQVDGMEYELAEQRAILEAMADEQGLDVEDVLDAADLPEPPHQEAEPTEEIPVDESAEEAAPSQQATSRPSVNEE
ncbi:hypothetical protein BRC65_03065 [Halobacteriales archaeon QH_2_65_14]|jgi:methyl-accepting chemotaxis protein|nr:MAG: hypothetical protein BRC65_03065 [Halobacteriales archaeon QH_2_65_14]